VAGYGSGKSECLVLAALNDLFSHPGANIGIYSVTYDLLRLILVPRFEQYLEQIGVRFTLNKTEYLLTVEGYGMLVFRSLDRENRIIGYEVFRSHIDELDTMPLSKAESVWLKVIARNRQVVKGHEGKLNKIGIYTTPEGYNWSYKYFSSEGEAYRSMTEESQSMYNYVKASTESNPHLPEGYISAIKATYPEHLINAYLRGEWTNLNSGRVYPSFDRRENACDTMEKPGEPIHIGMDFNVTRGCSVAHVIRNEEAHAIFEIYNAYDTPEQIAIIKERFGDKRDIIIYPDASGKQRRSVNATKTDMQLLKDAGFRVKEYSYNGSIKDRVTCVNAIMCDGSGHRRYRVNYDQCPNTVNSLSTQVYDINGLPEKGAGKQDDLNDAVGYFVIRKYPLVKPKATKLRMLGTY
jgi:hypothetical protein